MTENSIAQIVAEIKAKVRDIEAQLSAIEVGELPEKLKQFWGEAIKAWHNTKNQIDALNVEELNNSWQWILFDLRAPLTLVHGNLQFLFRAKEAGLNADLLPHIKAKIHETLPYMINLSELIREIEHVYRGDI